MLQLAVSSTVKQLKEMVEQQFGHSELHWKQLTQELQSTAVPTLEEVSSTVHEIPLDLCEECCAARRLIFRAWASRGVFRKETKQNQQEDDGSSGASSRESEAEQPAIRYKSKRVIY